MGQAPGLPSRIRFLGNRHSRIRLLLNRPAGAIRFLCFPRLAFHHRFQKLRVLFRHRRPIALLRDVIPRARAQRQRHFRARRQQVEVLEDGVFLARAHRHFEAHIVGELGEASDVGNQRRLAQPHRPQQRARTFAHRRVAQVEDDVAGRKVAGEIVDRHKAHHPHAGGEPQRANHSLQRKIGMRLAHQNHFRFRRQTQQAAEGAQRFGNSLVGFEKTEDAHQRYGLVEAQPLAKPVAVARRNPRAVRNHRQRPAKPTGADFRFHEPAMHDHTARAFELSLIHI